MTPSDWTAERIQDTARAFMQCRVLLSGFELGVFTRLANGEKSAETLAGELGTAPRATDRLLNALCAIGLLEKKDGLFRNTPAAARHLVAGRPEYLGGLMHTVNLWESWSTLTESVRRGTSAALKDNPHINDRGSKWLEAFIAAMHANSAPKADQLVRMIDLTNVKRVLDVGGGSGAYAMAFVRAAETIHATVFDLPNVIPLTKRYIECEGLADRIDTVVGDYGHEELGGGYDLVFLSAIVHSNSPEENRDLIAKSARALNPGGRVMVQDFIVSEDRTAPPFAALFALNMLVGTAAGDTFTEAEIRDWMTAAGLATITRFDTPFGTGIITGGKRQE